MPSGIESNADAALVFSNFEKELEDYSEKANPKWKGRQGITGAGLRFLEVVEEMRDRAGDIPAAIALERTRSRMNLSYLALYYEARPYSEIEDIQEQGESEFEFWMNQFIDEMMREPEAEEEPEHTEEEPLYPPEDEGGTAEPEEVPAPEPKPLTKKQQLKKEYREARKNLQKLIRRRKNAGVDVKIEVPKIPKKITVGSIRNLLRIAEKVKDEYRYLSGRGYRGANR